MQTIGEYFRSQRRKKKYSLSDLEDIIKIRKEFLKAIEKDDWKKLPDQSVVLGFVKNIARALEIPQEKALALFRRDYPPSFVPISPKAQKKEFRWSPKLTFAVGVSIIVLIIASYLGAQFLNFTRPPFLEVYEPTEEQIVRKRNLKVIGKTDSSATIRVNNQPVIVGNDGEFETELNIYEGTHEVEVIATSRSGKESSIKRKIKPDL